MRLLHAPLVIVVALAACGDDSSFDVEPHCNPLGTNHCMTPWPSSAFEVADSATPTGRRLAIPEGTLPTNADGIAANPAGWNVADGFSPAAPIVLSWKGGVSAEGLPRVDAMDASLGAESPTILVDLTTGERVAHYAEVDVAAEATPDSQALFIRPAQRLAGGHRYAVGVTKRVKAKDGAALAVPPGFRALRDGETTSHPLLEAMRPRFGDVLAAMEAQGIAKGDLVVAWDFTVASDAFVVRDATTARDRALAALADHPIAYTMTTDEPIDDGSVIRRKIVGVLEAPLFLTNEGAAQEGTKLQRDQQGLPLTSGFYQIPYTAMVPACAYTSPTPVGMVMYGHGLLGDSGEVTSGVQRTTAAELCMIYVGTDMRGMSGMDLPAVARALNNISLADELMETQVQGLVNHVTLAHAMRTTFARSLFLDGSKQLADPEKVYYYGISQGGIFGTAHLAYEPTITRGVVAVGAANYSMLLDRSLDWPLYQLIISGAYPDPLDVTLAIGLFQMRWDKVEGSGIAHAVQSGELTGTPPKQLLMQIALGDEQVPNIGSWWQARSMGIPVLGPSPLVPWGLTAAEAPLDGGSALVIMEGGAPPTPVENIPPEDAGMHDLTRNQPAARRQIKEFFETGRIVNHCNGACVCPASCQ